MSSRSQTILFHSVIANIKQKKCFEYVPINGVTLFLTDRAI